MRLLELLADLPGVIAVTGVEDYDITRIVSDSRQAIPGALFVAYRGVDVDSHRYWPDAVNRGAVVVLGEQPRPPDLPTPYVQVADGRSAVAWLNAAWYGHPSRRITMVGITGTDGKTTTATILHGILRAAGRRAGLITTVSAVVGDVEHDTGLHTTTPDAPDVQRYLAQMRDAGTEIAVLETTSHGLAQRRVTACAFDVAVVTNITHEHLDFHGSYEAYREAKALLFRSLAQPPRCSKTLQGLAIPKTAVLNRDDSSYAYLAAIPAERTITYGLGRAEEPGAAAAPVLHLTAVNIRHTPSGTEFDAVSSVMPAAYHLVTPLLGDFNVYNVLAATGAALALGIDAAAIQAGVAAAGAVSGRMERVDRGQAFSAIVDFAHTPNALARALETARGLAGPSGRVIAVFGCAGLRDRAKRRLMGSEAARRADLTIITAEDPRTEALADIMAETAEAMAAAGSIEGEDFVQVADRQRAILHAVRRAHPGDVVIVCGKGHEQSMCFGAVEHPWRDQDAVRWALDTLSHAATDLPPFILPTWDA